MLNGIQRLVNVVFFNFIFLGRLHCSLLFARQMFKAAKVWLNHLTQD